MNQIIKNGKVLRGWTGVEAQTLSTDIIGSVNLKTGGVLVTAIMRNGMNVNSPDQATETITELIPGKEVKINICGVGSNRN